MVVGGAEKKAEPKKEEVYHLLPELIGNLDHTQGFKDENSLVRKSAHAGAIQMYFVLRKIPPKIAKTFCENRSVRLFLAFEIIFSISSPEGLAFFPNMGYEPHKFFAHNYA
jgi:tyrosyl-tRNA synthetase